MKRLKCLIIIVFVFFLTSGCKYNNILVEGRLRTALIPIDLHGKIEIQDRVSVDVERNQAERRMKILDAWLDIKKVVQDEETSDRS